MVEKLDLFDKKIIVLYILETAKKPLTTDQIVSFCTDFSDVTYFDICDYIQNLEKNGYLCSKNENDTIVYDLTDLGINVLKELLELIPGVDLYKLKKIITKNIPSMKKEYTIGTNLIPIKNDEFKVSCYIKDGNDELISITIYASGKDTAKRISHVWQEKSNIIYTHILDDLSL